MLSTENEFVERNHNAYIERSFSLSLIWNLLFHNSTFFNKLIVNSSFTTFLRIYIVFINIFFWKILYYWSIKCYNSMLRIICDFLKLKTLVSDRLDQSLIFLKPFTFQFPAHLRSNFYRVKSLRKSLFIVRWLWFTLHFHGLKFSHKIKIKDSPKLIHLLYSSFINSYTIFIISFKQ